MLLVEKLFIGIVSEYYFFKNMMKRLLQVTYAAALIAVSSMAFVPTLANAQVGVNIIIGSAPPPPRYEVVPAMRPGYIWAPGYWNWAGGRHVWRQGYWDRARPGYQYNRPRWEQGSRGWQLNRGGWAQEQRRAHRRDDKHDRRDYRRDDRNDHGDRGNHGGNHKGDRHDNGRGHAYGRDR